MDSREAEHFRKMAYDMVDYMINYFTTIRERRVLPLVKPGYLRKLLPSKPPEDPDKWSDLMKDIERVIMPGVTHWHSPHFGAYFPAANSPPAILADILSDTIGCIGFSWIASPACTELEMVMMDWLAQLLGLPHHFLFSKTGKGGGVIQGTASESCFVCLLAAKHRMIKNKMADGEDNEHSVASKLVGYASKEAHSSIERAGMLGMVKIRLLESDKNCSLRGATVEEAIANDKRNGKIPFMIIATLGTTSTLGFDDLVELGKIAQKEGLWLHVDAAYAGCSFVCPEFRRLMNGIEHVDSFSFNPHKWLLVNFDCSGLWVKNTDDLSHAFMVNPAYLKHAHQDKVPDFRHWQIPLGRRFRSLKIWFVLRLYGAEGLRNYIRRHVQLAHKFEAYVKSDDRFEVIYPVVLGLVCFRLKGSNEQNERLLNRINNAGQIHIVHTICKGSFILRYAVCSLFTTSADISKAWQAVCEQL
ncbi:hypothetical protein CHUAL_002008 [Chamberlinius hualienensis]